MITTSLLFSIFTASTKHARISLSSSRRLPYLLQICCVWLCFFLELWHWNQNKTKFTSNWISQDFIRKKKVWGDKTNRTTEAMETSPSYLMCTQSQIQYSQPFFSLSSESVRALSLMGCRGADGWMTGKMSLWKINHPNRGRDDGRHLAASRKRLQTPLRPLCAFFQLRDER